MKTILPALAPFLFPCLLAQAQFAGSDDFSASGKDPAKWGADFYEGGGGFSQTGDGVVRYTSDSADTSSAVWPWNVSYAPASNSWSAQLDVNVPAVDLAESTSAVGMGLNVYNDTDTDEFMTISLEQVRSGGPIQQNFLSSFEGNGGGAKEISTAAPASAAAVRISWNATTHALTAEYDADGPTGGYAWTALRTFDPTLGSSWNTPANGVFRIALAGYSEQVIIETTNDISADNFLATLGGGSEPSPSLSVSQSGGQVTLSWPAPATGFALETKTSLTPGPWDPIPDVPTESGGRRSVTLPFGSGNQFFRLKNQ